MGYGAAALGPDKVEAQLAKESQHGRIDERSAAEKHCQSLACDWQRCASRHLYKPHMCNEPKLKYKNCISEFISAAVTAEDPRGKLKR